MGERDPYGGSKGAAELVIRSYRHSFFPPNCHAEHGVKLASARAGNVVGGGDWTPDYDNGDSHEGLVSVHGSMAVRAYPWLLEATLEPEARVEFSSPVPSIALAAEEAWVPRARGRDRSVRSRVD